MAGDTETCACGAALDDGEGYDGQCGNCADRVETKRQAVIATLKWLGYTASSALLERDPSWQEHFEILLSNKTHEMTDEQRLAIWPDWKRSPLEEIALTARPYGGVPHVGPDSLPAMKARLDAEREAMKTQTAPAAKTVTLTYAVVTTEERSVEVPVTCPGAECGADLTVEKAITETWLVHCEFGGSFVVVDGKPTYRNGYVYSAYRSGFATVGFCCARCKTSLLP